MKVIDRFVIRDKATEKMMRQLDYQIGIMSNLNKLDKANFIEIQSLSLELFIKLFKQLENNVTPAKTLMDFTGREVQHACNCVGPSRVFEEDRDFVMAVMQELTK